MKKENNYYILDSKIYSNLTGIKFALTKNAMKDLAKIWFKRQNYIILDYFDLIERKLTKTLFSKKDLKKEENIEKILKEEFIEWLI